MDDRIGLRELEALFQNVDIADEALAPYLTGPADGTLPFAPALRLDPKAVAVTAAEEPLVDDALKGLNRLARWRRQQRFKALIAARPDAPVIVAEGDSWFQFPFLVREVVDHLEDRGYATRCVSAAGDTLYAMVRVEPEYRDVLAAERHRVKAFLLSGAGNDIVGAEQGQPVLERIVRGYEPGRDAAWYVATPQVASRLKRIESLFTEVLERADAIVPGVPVVLHGYDYAIPGGHPDDPRHPVYARRDQWLGAPLTRLGIRDHTLQREIVARLIDGLNDVLARLATRHGNARYVDLRGTLPRVTDWSDEIHPTSEGFRKVTDKLVTEIPAP